MVSTAWKLKNEESRWQISCVLETVTPLHIGSGEYSQHEAITVGSDDQEKYVDINACLKGKDDLPIIPGSTIKGQFYEWLKTRDVAKQQLENLFGRGHNPKNDDQGRGGKAEFHDAYLSRKLPASQVWPYWRGDTQTFIEASTAIDRHRQTALDQSLHYTEAVPSSVGFTFTITGVMDEQEAALLIAALDSFAKNQDQPCFGADDANGYGKMRLYGHLQVKKMGTAEISQWLTDFSENESNMVMDNAKWLLPQEEITKLIEQGKAQFQPINNTLILGINLTFSGPFLINDPYQVKALEKDEQRKTDHYPLLDKNGNPRLPTSSVRGVLRSQAERIVRTMGVYCCDTKNPCEAIYDSKDVSELCPVCQIFGASGWKSVIKIHDFVCLNSDKQNKQDFVAIDRFHGGGKDGAKFDATHYQSPEFKGFISLTPRLQNNDLAWGRGLLALLLRDLKEGDMTFGSGGNKGYGGLECVTIEGLERLFESDIQAFQTKCLESQYSWLCNSPKKPVEVGEKIPLTQVNAAANGFHNPYHFIPVKQPDTANWTPRAELEKNDGSSLHSHGFYRQQTEQGEPIYNGRIVCRLQTETPIFIGAGRAKQENQQPDQAQLIENYRLNHKLAIPATSLRGMIASMAEAASNSAMRVLDDELILSYRQKMGRTPTAIGMVIKIEGQWRLIPLALPALKEENGMYAIPREYKTMFPDGEAKLKVYLENAFTTPTEKVTWTKQNNKVFYMELDATQVVKGGRIPNSNQLRKPSKKPSFKPNNNPEFVIGQRVRNAEVHEFAQLGLTPGILRILGGKTKRSDIPNTKKHEVFIPISDQYVSNGQLDYSRFVEKETSFLIPEEVVKRFKELANQRTESQKDVQAEEEWLPYHLQGMQRNPDHSLSLHEGDLVYFSPNKRQNDLVAEIAFSSIWRGRVETSQGEAAKVHSFFPKDLLPFNKSRTSVSPAELLFGFTEINAEGDKNELDSLAFAGKVRVSAGLIAEAKTDTELLDGEVTLKALSTPKLPSPALYFRTQSAANEYISKDQLHPAQHSANGRKHYLHAMRQQNNKDSVQKLNSSGVAANSGDNSLPWVTQNEDRPQLKVKIKPIKSGQTFYFHLDFNNLTEWELGLLCYVLRPTESFRHRIGMGKPIGLGSVKIDIVALQTIDRKKRYGQDDLNAKRFNQHNWANQDYIDELNKAGYEVAETSVMPLIPDGLRKEFTDTMEHDIYRALDLLGNPHNIKHPVHYPQVENGKIEQENYKWFVANDQGSGERDNKINAIEDTLELITENSTVIPTLQRHPWRGN